MLKELRLCEVLCIAGMIAGCASEEAHEAVIQNIGLPASGVPPLGEGFAPITGRGGDGVPVVTAVGGWSTGPGAVKWHGGQWVMGYQAAPGSTLQNVACDVVPSATATDLIELVSSNGQVIGSNTVPATSSNVVIRSWIVLSPGHRVVDGEQVVLRHSPRDAATGAWTSANQDITIVSCSINAAAVPVSRPKSPALVYNDGSWSATRIVTDSTGKSMVAVTSLANGVARIELPHDDGDRITGLMLIVSGTGVSGANFVVERFNVSLPGGLTALGIPTSDNNRSNTWTEIGISVTPTALLADDILYLNLSDSNRSTGYSVGGVIPLYERP